MRKRSRRLGPEDWAAAALEALARGGIEAIAVEPIAEVLGATKGSFYWHFKNRDALVEAALKLWEQQRTDAVIEYLEREAGPARRLRVLVEAAYEKGPVDRVEVALLANPNHRAARRVLQRVAERRIQYLADQLEALGWEPEEARDRALLIGYVYIGGMQMALVAPKLTDPRTRRRRVDLVFNTLVAGGVLPPTVETSSDEVNA
ncbi:MAG: TetR/AcrR family transcriptional regulator [Actinomycetota bacterium]|nr:TetR/AcrR family transcriptional regulator [Actinomycetota bacterium]